MLYQGDGLSSSTYEVDGGFCRRSESSSSSRAYGRFAGKVAIVTGAAGNFGSACARRLTEEGARVVLFDLRPADEALGSVHVVDVTDAAAVDRAVDVVAERYGRIDFLFNNAGFQGDFASTATYDPSNFAKVTSININGCFNVLRAVAKVMTTQSPQGGAIVQTASMAAHSAPPNMIAYASSKAAVAHMTKVASKDLAPANIRVNSVSPAFIGPGFMWTRQVELQAAANSVYYDQDPSVVAKQMVDCVPLKRYGSIDEVIGPVLFLFSDDASYLTGVDIQITGGIN